MQQKLLPVTLPPSAPVQTAPGFVLSRKSRPKESRVRAQLFSGSGEHDNQSPTSTHTR